MIDTDLNQAPTPAQTSDKTGALPPIRSRSGQSRLDKVTPHTVDEHILQYRSEFVRTFIRSDYNFFAAKVQLARGGKVKALDRKFQEIDDWFIAARRWLDTKPKRRIPLDQDSVKLVVPHPLAGRLIRVLIQYEDLFAECTFAMVMQSIDSDARTNTIQTAANKIRSLKSLCIPEPDKFDADGKLIKG